METGSLLAVKAPRVLIIGLPGNSQNFFFFLVAAFFKEEKEVKLVLLIVYLTQ